MYRQRHPFAAGASPPEVYGASLPEAYASISTETISSITATVIEETQAWPNGPTRSRSGPGTGR